MTDKKDVIPTKILWVDLEMTGLDPAEDVILEIAAEITDFNFKTLESYEARVKQDHAKVVERMQKNTWWTSYPANRDEFLRNRDETKSMKTIEDEMLELVERHFGEELAILGGNSIYNDRMFIKNGMPALDLKLHYRMLDVSAWKVLMQGKFGVNYEKVNSHRAYDDIQASIAELQSYLDWFRENRS